MADTELETLLVRLKGDGTSYQKMLDDSRAATKEFKAEVDSLTAFENEAKDAFSRMRAQMQENAEATKVSAAGFGAWVTFLPIATEAAGNLIYEMSGYRQIQEDVNKEIERGARLEAELTAIQKERRQEVMSLINSLKGAEKRTTLEEALASAKNEAAGAEQQIKDLKEELEPFNKPITQVSGQFAIERMFSGEKADIMKRLAEAEKQYGELFKHRIELEKELEDMDPGSERNRIRGMAEARKELEAYTKSLEHKNRVLEEGSEERARISEIRDRGFASPEDINKLEDELEAHEKLAKVKKEEKEFAAEMKRLREDEIKDRLHLEEGVRKYTESLKREIEMFGKSAEEKRIAGFIAKGARREELADAEAFAKRLKQMEEDKKATEKGKLLEEKNVPGKKFSREYEELLKLFQAGKIGAITFREEVDKLEQEYIKMWENVRRRKLSNEVFDNEAVRKGSDEFKKMLKDVGARKFAEDSLLIAKMLERGIREKVGAGGAAAAGGGGLLEAVPAVGAGGVPAGAPPPAGDRADTITVDLLKRIAMAAEKTADKKEFYLAPLSSVL